MSNSVQRRLAAILAADVVGYSRLMGEDEAGTRERFNARLGSVVQPALSLHGGRLVKTMGDGFLVEFTSVVGALQAAVDIQAGSARLAREEPNDSRIELRIGIHLGDVIVEGYDIHGDGVNIASRLEALAEPGGICVSDMVHAGVRGKVALGFTEMGAQSLKNITDPVRVFRAHLDTSLETKSASDALLRRPAVAVLPFENLSGDAEQDYFADGLTEDIITALSHWRWFPVIARNSTFIYKGRPVKVQEVAKDLGARYVLEGSVRKGGDRVRVTAQLIDAETGHHLWAERYDRDLTDIFELQDELTEQIAAIVAPELESAEQRRLSTLVPANDDAWDCVQRGIAHFHAFTHEGNDLAKGMFEKAIELDPNYCQAYCWLSYSHLRDYWLGYADDPEETKESFLRYGRRAVELDDKNAFAHSTLAVAYMWAGSLGLSVKEAETAIALNPTDSIAYACLGHGLAMLGDRREGIRNSKKALQLNPRDPRGHVFFTLIAFAYLLDGQFSSAVQWANEAVQRGPDFAEAHFVAAVSLGYQGRTAEAQNALALCRRIDPEFLTKWPASRPYFASTQITYCLDGLRKAGWNG